LPQPRQDTLRAALASGNVVRLLPSGRCQP